MTTTSFPATDPVKAAHPSTPSPRKQKLIAVLDRRRSVITTGVDSTMNDYRGAIGELLKRANAAYKQGIELPTFLAILRDQAER